MAGDQVPDLRNLGALLGAEHGAGGARSGGPSRRARLLIASPHPRRPACPYLPDRGGSAGTLGQHGERSPAQAPIAAEAPAWGPPANPH